MKNWVKTIALYTVLTGCHSPAAFQLSTESHNKRNTTTANNYNIPQINETFSNPQPDGPTAAIFGNSENKPATSRATINLPWHMCIHNIIFTLYGFKTWSRT